MALVIRLASVFLTVASGLISSLLRGRQSRKTILIILGHF